MADGTLCLKPYSSRLNSTEPKQYPYLLRDDPYSTHSRVEVTMDRLLVVDDDTELCSLVTEYLEVEGFQVDTVNDGQEGIERALSGEYSLVVLDVMLPSVNGFDVLRRIRAESRVPVLMLSARAEDVERIVGLQIGADDYLAKPFNPHELVARIRAIIRRTQPNGELGPDRIHHPTLNVGDIELDKNAWKVRRAGKPVELTALEFNLLEMLLRSAGQVVPREELVQTLLGREFDPFDRSIDMHVSNLRKKLGRQLNGVERIKSVRGVGYVYPKPDTLEGAESPSGYQDQEKSAQ